MASSCPSRYAPGCAALNWLPGNGQTSGASIAKQQYFEHVAGEHDLSAFFALRTMDEIMVNNFMTFTDLMESEYYDLVMGDEAWDVDYYYHENPELKREIPDMRLILVTGPRLSDEPFPELPGLEVRPYVHNLFEHLACCDLALVQGGLSTCMELVATRRPFLCFPLQSHFEQRIHVQQRLRNYGADCAIEYNSATPEDLANAALARMHQPVSYRPVETTGAIQAATLIARVLSASGSVR